MSDDVSERLAALERRLDRLEALLVQSGQSPAAPPRVVLPPVPRGPAAEPLGSVVSLIPRRSLEQAIGLRWAAWVGAVVLVIGAGLGIDFAYHEGWFNFVSPAVRVGLLVVAAAGLVGVGEVVYRRVSPWSAVGPFAAGVAVLFLAAYAGYAFYELYGRGTAFALMAMATVVGAAVARRGDLVSIAAVAIVGGNLAPALLRAGLPQPVGFLTYLLTLQIVAVALALGGGPKWWTLRGLSLATTAAWVAVVIGQPGFGGTVTVAFVVAYALVYHGERIASAARGDGEPAGSVAFGACVTAALAAAVLFLTGDDSTVFRTGEVLAMAAATAALAAACGRGGTALRAVGVSFVIQSVGLVALAVPVATSGPWVVVGWELLAVALAVGGRWSTASAYAAPAVWALAAGDLLLWAEGMVGQGHGVTVLTVAGSAVPSYVVVAWSVAAGGHVVAELTRRRTVEGRAELAVGVDAASAVTWVAASMLGLPTGGATAAVVAYAGVTTAAGLTAVGAAAAVFAAVKWMAADTLLWRPSTGATWTTAALGVAIVGVLVAVGWVNRRHGRVARRAARVFAVVVGVWAATVVLDAALTTATPRAEQVAISILWAASATAVVAAGFGRRLADLRYAGLGLFAVTLLKVVAVDLSGVGTGWRILSFLGLGGLLIATSVLYGRLGSATDGR